MELLREDVGGSDSENEGALVNDSDSEDEGYVVREDSNEDDYCFDPKSCSIIDPTNQGNKVICQRPSNVLTIDEQVNRAKGRSKENHRMKDRSIR